MVSKAKAKRDKVFRMGGLAVQAELRGRGLAAKAIRRFSCRVLVHAGGWSGPLHEGGGCGLLPQTGRRLGWRGWDLGVELRSI